MAEGRISLAAVALFLIVSGGSMVILGAIPVAVPILGLPVAVYALGILARDGVVVAAGHLLVVAAVAGVWLLSGQVAG